jgi:hypothetical protein
VTSKPRNSLSTEIGAEKKMSAVARHNATGMKVLRTDPVPAPSKSEAASNPKATSS